MPLVKIQRIVMATAWGGHLPGRHLDHLPRQRAALAYHAMNRR